MNLSIFIFFGIISLISILLGLLKQKETYASYFMVFGALILILLGFTILPKNALAFKVGDNASYDVNRTNIITHNITQDLGASDKGILFFFLEGAGIVLLWYAFTHIYNQKFTKDGQYRDNE
jgi:hypothetical protein